MCLGKVNEILTQQNYDKIGAVGPMHLIGEIGLDLPLGHMCTKVPDIRKLI